MAASIFNGSAVKILKNILRYKDGTELSSTDAANLSGTTGNLQTQINDAQADATQALSDAAAAQSDATQALSDAASAQSDATQALADAAAAQSTANAAIPATEKGANNGVATLDGGGKVPVSQLPNSIMQYLGTWAASTNTPTLTNGTGNAGDVYIASDAGTVNFGAGPITFATDDWVVYSGSVWQRSVNSNAVASVNGQTGAVVVAAQDLSNLTTTAINQDLIPDADGTRSLGASTERWNNVHANQIVDGTNTNAVDINARQLVDELGNTIMYFDSSLTRLTDPAGLNVLGFTTGQRLLSDSTGNDSINFTARQLKSSTTVKLDWSGTDVSLNTRKLTNVSDPTNPQDVATKNYVDSNAGSGTVTDVSVVSANGFAGSVATSTSTPAITLSTTVTGVLQGNGTAISAASTTGSGNVVLATSPTLVTPALGTPSALVLTNATGLPVAGGGTGQSTYTDGQLLIGNSVGNTLSKSTLTAGTNITVTNGNGSITIAAPSILPGYNYTAQTTTYSATISDYILCSGASFTITLPTAVGQAGKGITIEHGGTLGQVYTLATTSSQTIGGIASGSYALYTAGEILVLISDGANWRIQSHKTKTSPVSVGSVTIVASGGGLTLPSGVVLNDLSWWRDGMFAFQEFNLIFSNTTGAASGTGDYLLTTVANITPDAKYVAYNTISSPTNFAGSGATRSSMEAEGWISNGTSRGAINQAMLYSSTQIRVPIEQYFTNAGAWSASFYGIGAATTQARFTIKMKVSGWQP